MVTVKKHMPWWFQGPGLGLLAKPVSYHFGAWLLGSSRYPALMDTGSPGAWNQSVFQISQWCERCQPSHGLFSESGTAGR